LCFTRLLIFSPPMDRPTSRMGPSLVFLKLFLNTFGSGSLSPLVSWRYPAHFNTFSTLCFLLPLGCFLSRSLFPMPVLSPPLTSWWPLHRPSPPAGFAPSLTRPQRLTFYFGHTLFPPPSPFPFRFSFIVPPPPPLQASFVTLYPLPT